MTPCFVGFDTSNYTTSVAVCDAEGHVVANCKAPLPVGEGERGLRQSDAVFAHIKNLPELCERLGAVMADAELTPVAVGVSSRPRDVQGSYMPCFLSGRSAAYAFAAANRLPVHEFSHQNGHILAALYSCGAAERLLSGRFFAFHVSGGTTEVLLVEPLEDTLSVTLAAQTDDLNGGQLIDRVGVAMGLSFPCGKEMERLAAAYAQKPYRHPVCVRQGRCSLSGAVNIALRLWNETKDKEAVAAFVFDFLGRTLVAMGEQVQQEHGSAPVLFAGGVMSNRLMRKALLERFDAYFSEPAFSADNAAGIALLCRWAEMRNQG